MNLNEKQKKIGLPPTGVKGETSDRSVVFGSESLLTISFDIFIHKINSTIKGGLACWYPLGLTFLLLVAGLEK